VFLSLLLLLLLLSLLSVIAITDCCQVGDAESRRAEGGDGSNIYTQLLSPEKIEQLEVC
jgi:hypothetical protein